jgi:hypothetical protein
VKHPVNVSLLQVCPASRNTFPNANKKKCGPLLCSPAVVPVPFSVPGGPQTNQCAQVLCLPPSSAHFTAGAGGLHMKSWPRLCMIRRVRSTTTASDVGNVHRALGGKGGGVYKHRDADCQSQAPCTATTPAQGRTRLSRSNLPLAWQSDMPASPWLPLSLLCVLCSSDGARVRSGDSFLSTLDVPCMLLPGHCPGGAARGRVCVKLS